MRRVLTDTPPLVAAADPVPAASPMAPPIPSAAAPAAPRTVAVTPMAVAPHASDAAPEGVD